MNWNSQRPSIQEIVKKVYSPSFNLKEFAKHRLSFDPSSNPPKLQRPFSASFEGGSLGDEGKGSVVVRYIQGLKKQKKKIITYRWNGGANAGHECMLPDGSKLTLHQFPVGVIEEGATGVVGRGMVFHPGDAIVELETIKKRLGGLPGNLLIDWNVGLALDTHRAMETVINTWYFDHAGATTSRGIALAYADEILRTRLTFRDLLAPEWRKKFLYNYELTKQHLQGFGFDLENVHVLSDFAGTTIPVGTRNDFIERLALQREYFSPFAQDIHDMLTKEWFGGKSAFIFEGANGVGLHPRHGVYPDVTTSEIRARGIQDSTEGIISHNAIGARFGVIKGTYMSSVGIRVMPGFLNAGDEVSIRNAFGEFGKTTGRPRGVLPFDIPAISYWRSISDYEYLVVTHMDSNFEKILVVADYKNEKGEKVAYRPYQWYLNSLSADFIELPGWDGKKATKAKRPQDLPENALRYIAFLELALQVKVAWVTTGQEEKDIVSFLPLPVIQ